MYHSQGYSYPVNHQEIRHYLYYRPFPPVNPDILFDSALEAKKLMNDVSNVLDKLRESKEFDTILMNAAQDSNYDEVKRLIKSIGLESDVDIRFDPHGMQLEFMSMDKTKSISSVKVSLRWR
jgi:hypothetical protein